MHAATLTLCPSSLCWSRLTTFCIYGSTSTLFLSGSQQSGPTSSNFPLVLLLISTQSHMWDVTAVDGPGTLYVSVGVCVLSERSHTWAISRRKVCRGLCSCLWPCVFVFVSVIVCIGAVQTCLNALTHMSVSGRPYLTLMWSQQSETSTFTGDQIALQEDHLVMGSRLWLL